MNLIHYNSVSPTFLLSDAFCLRKITTDPHIFCTRKYIESGWFFTPWHNSLSRPEPPHYRGCTITHNLP